MYRLAAFFSCLLLVLTSPVFAQSTFPPYAYSDGHNVVVTQPDGTSTTITNFAKDGDDPIDSITWSGDGKMLAFVANIMDANNNPETALFMSDGKTQAVKLADNLDSSFPVLFTQDNQIMFIEISPDAMQVTDPTQASVDLYTVSAQAGSTPQLLQPLDYNAMFGDGFDPILAIEQYKHETRHANGNYLTLSPVPDGLVYSTAADGIGVKLFVANLELPISDDMARVAVSPDGQRVAGVKLNDNNSTQLLVATLSTDPRVKSVVKTVKTVLPPDQVVWGGPDKIYYTTIKNEGTIFEKDELLKLNGLINGSTDTPIDGIDNHQVSIRLLDLTTGADTEVYASDPKPEAADNSYAIARLSFVNGKLYFVSVPGMSGWARYVLDGKVNVQDPAGLVQSDSQFPLMVFQLDPATNTIMDVGFGLHQVAFSPAK